MLTAGTDTGRHCGWLVCRTDAACESYARDNTPSRPTITHYQRCENRNCWIRERTHFSSVSVSVHVPPLTFVLLIRLETKLVSTCWACMISSRLNKTVGSSNADNPAFKPVIYDPNARSGHRFSSAGIPASTIPRLYHSTASLTPNGSIIVAGSNPNDNVQTREYPTEYRYKIPCIVDGTLS